MRKFRVDYERVYEETARHAGYVATEVVAMAENEYGQMRRELAEHADGAANEAFIEALGLHRAKMAEAAGCVTALLSFIHDSAKQIEAAERKMAQSFRAHERLRGA